MAQNSYNIEDLLDKTLWAKQSVPIYSQPQGDTIIRTVAPGERVGIIYSFVQRNGAVYWQLYDDNMQPGALWVEHKQGIFDEAMLAQQGVLTLAEIEKKRLEEEARQNLPFFQKLGLGEMNPTKYIILALLIYIIIEKLND